MNSDYKDLPEWVYVARLGEFVKIGTSRDPIGRVNYLHLKNGNWPASLPRERLEFVLYVPGGRELERLIHDELSAHREVGEWFRITPEVEAVIAELQVDADRVRAEDDRALERAMSLLFSGSAAS